MIFMGIDGYFELKLLYNLLNKIYFVLHLDNITLIKLQSLIEINYTNNWLYQLSTLSQKSSTMLC